MSEKQGNLENAGKWFKTAANCGSADGQHRCGVELLNGSYGCARNEALAVRWLRASSAQNQADALFELGECHRFGFGVDPDLPAAREHYKRSFSFGCQKAKFALKKLEAEAEQDGSHKAGHSVSGPAAASDAGSSAGQSVKLSSTLQSGSRLSPEEMFSRGIAATSGKEKGEWYRKAAEQGHAGAQFNRSICYTNGQGVAKDEQQAVQWYRKAAE